MIENNMEYQTKICKKCGRLLPIENFRLCKGQFGNPYYRGSCKECELDYDREYHKNIQEEEFTFSDKLEISIKRKYKKIDPARILDIDKIGIDIVLLGTDEIFVRLMDYKDAWLSNYGRVITFRYGKYNLLNGSYVYGDLRYSVSKNVFIDGKWEYKQKYLYAAKAVIDTFIVNEDKANNIYIWHSGYDKEDCYYRNLYPLNQEQFRIVKSHFNKTGDDSEEFILKVMNDIRYKPDKWKRKSMQPVLYGRGYHGLLYTNSKEESYERWHGMMNRCYSQAVHEKYPKYIGCEVCEEWLNYSNFKLWYDEHIVPWKILGKSCELDKDIIIKGNKTYSAETACFVPSVINTLFTKGDGRRGDCPLGVYRDKTNGKYRAEMNFCGKKTKLGTFDTVEAAFARYKEYKEDFIKDMANQYKDQIPDKLYQAMIKWEVEITD